MNAISPLFRSLLLTGLFSFAIPSVFIGGGLTSFYLIRQLPTLRGIGQSGAQLILQFLTTFGNGHPFQGLLIIGMAFSLVGVLFESYLYYLSPRGS